MDVPIASVGIYGVVPDTFVSAILLENPRKLTPSRHFKLTPLGHFKLTP